MPMPFECDKICGFHNMLPHKACSVEKKETLCTLKELLQISSGIIFLMSINCQCSDTQAVSQIRSVLL